MKNRKLALAIGATLLALGAQSAMADCASIKNHVSRTELQNKLNDAVAAVNTGGYSGVTGMWVTLVDESGKVCEVASSKSDGASSNSGKDAGRIAWLGSRVISAQKANTANAFSLDNYAISTANLYAAVQEGGSLYGLQHSNPVDPTVAYQGSSAQFGTASDPLRNKRVGGINVFGGGLALYKSGHKIGAIGVSGDTSCRDHAVAWQIRHNLGVDAVPNGITKTNFKPTTNAPVDKLNADVKGDEMILKTANSDTLDYWNNWAQPECPNSHDTSNSGTSTDNTSTLFTSNGTLVIPAP